jgi:predicted dehydrogenase
MAKLRLIRCGVGGFGKSWLTDSTTISPDFEVVALVDIMEGNLAAAGDEAGIPGERRFRTLAEALDKFLADAVLTVTPPPFTSSMRASPLPAVSIS